MHSELPREFLSVHSRGNLFGSLSRMDGKIAQGGPSDFTSLASSKLVGQW